MFSWEKYGREQIGHSNKDYNIYFTIIYNHRLDLQRFRIQEHFRTDYWRKEYGQMKSISEIPVTCSSHQKVVIHVLLRTLDHLPHTYHQLSPQPDGLPLGPPYCLPTHTLHPDCPPGQRAPSGCNWQQKSDTDLIHLVIFNNAAVEVLCVIYSENFKS